MSYAEVASSSLAWSSTFDFGSKVHSRFRQASHQNYTSLHRRNIGMWLNKLIVEMQLNDNYTNTHSVVEMVITY